jgi:cell division protein ZapA
MASRSVELRVGGQNYRVVSSANEQELRHLAGVVDQKLTEIMPPGRPITPQAILLAAMALAHDLEEAKRRNQVTAGRARQAFERMLARVDGALEPDGSTGS